MLTNLAISSFRQSQSGRVVGPEDPDYDQLRRVFAGDVESRPAIIVRPESAADVARAVVAARDSELPLAVRSGGHSHLSAVDGCILIDLRELKTVEVDAASRTAWAGSGATAGAYTSVVAAHGLATGFGDTGSVGLGGITLGGGIGYLVRKHGLTIDSVIGAEIVTSDGRVLDVNAGSHPDLFWAIRGGGGNFGIATRFRYRLHPVDRIVGGMMLLPATVDTVAGVIELAEAAPEELSIIANVMTAPPLPFVPAAHHGKLVVMLLMCHADAGPAAARTIDRFRKLAEPIADLVQPKRYVDLFPAEDESYHPTAVGRTMFLDRVDRDIAGTMLDYLHRSDASMRVAQLRVLGGAAARVTRDATAFAHRDARILANVAAFYNGRDDRPRRDAWVTQFAAALRQGHDGAYVGFVGDEGPARVRAAYPQDVWTRLASIKARYDPDNVFRSNHNIAPERPK